MGKEYIEREAVLAKSKPFRLGQGERWTGGAIPRFISESDVINAPAADVVEVPCRCKDCKNNPNFERHTKGMVWCRKFRCEVRETGFCSYGEKRK